MTAAREKQPSTDQVDRFLLYLVEVLTGIIPVPPEVMVRLGSDLADIPPNFSPHAAAEPPALYRILGMLCEDQKPTMGELSGALSLPLSTVSRMVGRLEERGYAERLPDAADGRVVRVALTDSGRHLYETTVANAARNAHRILGCLTPEELTIFLTLLAKVVHSLKKDT